MCQYRARWPSVAASDEKYTFVDDDDDALSAHVREHFSDDQSVSSQVSACRPSTSQLPFCPVATVLSDGLVAAVLQNMAKASPLKIKIKAQEALAGRLPSRPRSSRRNKARQHVFIDGGFTMPKDDDCTTFACRAGPMAQDVWMACVAFHMF